MLWLPPISGDASPRWLPVCDRSAVWLADALLEDSRSSAHALEELLSQDSALAQWTAAHCAAEQLPSTTLPELALGLAKRALDWLKAVRYTETAVPPDDLLGKASSPTDAAAAGLQTDSRARLLPIVVERLSRLKALEGRFAAELEEARLSAMAEFAAGAGHEINNPLAVISGRAQLCMKNETDPERRKDLSLISAQAMRIYEMIADMRLFARPPKPVLARLEVATLFERLRTEMSAAAAEQGTELLFAPNGETASEPLSFYGDATQLHVALKAVVQNAIEALAERGTIRLSARRQDRTIEISVADNGPGILPEQRPHIFDPYYSARQAGRGLGMGLSKCWRIVRNHGGSIDVEDVPGGGALFKIRLPAVF